MKHLKSSRLLALLCVVAIFFTIAPTAFAYGSASDWAKEELDKAQELGLIPPELNEKVNLRVNITRMEMCILTVHSYELYTGKEITYTEEKPFTDTDSPVAAKAYAAGLVNGYEDHSFHPERTLTRQEFFSFVHKFLRASGWTAKDSDYDDLSRFTDRNQLYPWAVPSAQIVVGIGVVEGSGNELFPRSQTTCEQAIAMFTRAYLVLTGETQPPVEPTEPPVEPSDPPTEPTEPPVEPTDPPTFEEKYPNMQSWAAQELRPMDEEGLIPELLIGRDMRSDITRKEVCYLAVTAFDKLNPDFPQKTYESPFTDVDDQVISKAHYLEIIKGFPDNTFRPDEPITREQFFKITGSFLSVAGYPKTDDSSIRLLFYDDGNQVADYAKPSTRLLCRLGIVKGTKNCLLPKSQTQCQQALAMFYRTYCYYENWLETGEDPPLRPQADELVAFALQFKGYPYVWGGKDPSGFDCSGLVYYVYHRFHYDDVPRTAYYQWFYEGCQEVPLSAMLPGDLVFFSNDGTPDGIYHVGIYVGNDQYLHAANSKRGVVVDSTNGAYFRDNVLGAQRIIP